MACRRRLRPRLPGGRRRGCRSLEEGFGPWHSPPTARSTFVDSLSDAGNLSITTSAGGVPFPVSPPSSPRTLRLDHAAVFSNGPTWVQNLPITVGLGTLKPSFAGGTDFAYGGANGPDPQDPTFAAVQAVSLGSQLTQFQLDEPKPSANALYTLSIGANDLNNILAINGLTAEQEARGRDRLRHQRDQLRQTACRGRCRPSAGARRPPILARRPTSPRDG